MRASRRFACESPMTGPVSIRDRWPAPADWDWSACGSDCSSSAARCRSTLALPAERGPTPGFLCTAVAVRPKRTIRSGRTFPTGPSPRKTRYTPSPLQYHQQDESGVWNRTMTRPRVLLADDHRLLREAFAALLQSECDVVGAVADGRAVLELSRELRPDIVVLDIAMPLLNGMDAARQLKQTMPDVKIIFLTVSEDRDLAAEAFRVGASGYLLKNSAASELMQAIREVSAGRSYVTPLATQSLVDSFLQKSEPAKSPSELSARQREVLQLLAEGHTMKEIAG